jgi:hypothetical protein
MMGKKLNYAGSFIFFSFGLIFSISVAGMSAQTVAIEADSLAATMEALRLETSVPIRVPSRLPEKRSNAAYTAAPHQLTADSYTINFLLPENCSEPRCIGFYIHAVKIPPKIKTALPGRRVPIDVDKFGRFTGLDCRYPCIDAFLTWQENGYEYRLAGKETNFEELLSIYRSLETEPASGALQRIFPDIPGFLNTYLRKTGFVLFAGTGDLDGDGRADWTGLVGRRDSGRTDRRAGFGTVQLYVLLAQKSGGFRIAGKTSERIFPGLVDQTITGLLIRQGSIYLQIDRKNGGKSTRKIFRFERRMDDWRLTGLRIIVPETQGTSTTTETDMNLLTGEVLVVRQTGGEKSFIESRRKNFPGIYLKDFDYFYADPGD